MNKIKHAEDLLKNYFLLEDSKILFSVIKTALEVMDGILSKFSEGKFEERLLFYKINIESKYDLNTKFSKIIQEAHQILKEHKDSPIEITFKKKISIYSEKYNLTELTEEFAIEIVEKAKLFIEVTLTILSDE